MGLRTVIAIALALTTFVQSAPQFIGDELLEDKRLYLKGQQRKKAEYLLKDDGKINIVVFRPAEVVQDQREYIQQSWPTQAPWPKDYWRERKLIAEERVNAALRILNKNRPQLETRNFWIDSPQPRVVKLDFDFPVANRARRHKRDLMEVNAEGSPLTAVYKDNVIAEIEPYGSEKKTDESAKVEEKKSQLDMTETNIPDIKVSDKMDNEMKPSMIETEEKTSDMTTTPKPQIDMEGIMNKTALQMEDSPGMVEMVMNMENSTYITKPDDMMMSNNTPTTMKPEISNTVSTGTPTSTASSEVTPVVEDKVSSTKGFQLCSEDGLSCARTTSSPPQEKSTSESTAMPSSTASEMMAPSSSTDMMMDQASKSTEDPISTTVDTMEATATPPREEYIEKIPLAPVPENKPPVPIVVLRPVENLPVEEMTTEKPESDMKPMLEMGRSFDTASGLEVNLIPVDANQTENTISSESSTEMMTKMPELQAEEDEMPSSTTTTTTPAPTEISTTPSPIAPNETKDESVMDKVANWFGNAWESVKSLF